MCLGTPDAELGLSNLPELVSGENRPFIFQQPSIAYSFSPRSEGLWNSPVGKSMLACQLVLSLYSLVWTAILLGFHRSSFLVMSRRQGLVAVFLVLLFYNCSTHVHIYKHTHTQKEHIYITYYTILLWLYQLAICIIVDYSLA